MAGFRERWPAGMSGEVKDLRDGTSIRGLSPHRGSLGTGPTSPDRTAQSTVERLLGRLRLASSGAELQRTLVDLLGPQCFSLGVLAGIGVDIVSSVVDLVKLIGKLALAGLHDINTGHVHWSRYFEPTVAPRLITGRIAGAFFGLELRKAAAERDALVQELSKAFADPKAFFETVSDQLIAHYQKEWQDFQNHMAANSLEGRFRAGMIFGELLLLVVFGVATGVYGAARLTAKAASELPRLARYGQSFARRGSKGGTSGSTGTAQTPSQLRTAINGSGTTSNSAHPGRVQSRQTGASGGAAQSADEAYEAIRASTTDVSSIARHTGIKPENIQKVKDHLFVNSHNLDRYERFGVPAEFRRFDSSADIAVAWKRLETGTYTPKDIQLLKHETAEAWYMRRHGQGYSAAHDAAGRYPSPLE